MTDPDRDGQNKLEHVAVVIMAPVYSKQLPLWC